LSAQRWVKNIDSNRLDRVNNTLAIDPVASRLRSVLVKVMRCETASRGDGRNSHIDEAHLSAKSKTLGIHLPIKDGENHLHAPSFPHSVLPPEKAQLGTYVYLWP